MVTSISLGALFAIFGVLGWQTTQLSGSAAAYPAYVLGVLAVLLLGIAVGEVRRRGPLKLDPELADCCSGSGRERGALVAFVVTWVAYVLLLDAIGFLAATALAIAASLLLLGQRHTLFIAAGSIGFSLALAVLVKTVLYVPVPLAAPDLALERLIYSLRTKP